MVRSRCFALWFRENKKRVMKKIVIQGVLSNPTVASHVADLAKIAEVSHMHFIVKETPDGFLEISIGNN